MRFHLGVAAPAGRKKKILRKYKNTEHFPFSRKNQAQPDVAYFRCAHCFRVRGQCHFFAWQILGTHFWCIPFTIRPWRGDPAFRRNQILIFCKDKGLRIGRRRGWRWKNEKQMKNSLPPSVRASLPPASLPSALMACERLWHEPTSVFSLKTWGARRRMREKQIGNVRLRRREFCSSARWLYFTCFLTLSEVIWQPGSQ